MEKADLFILSLEPIKLVTSSNLFLSLKVFLVLPVAKLVVNSLNILLLSRNSSLYFLLKLLTDLEPLSFSDFLPFLTFTSSSIVSSWLVLAFLMPLLGLLLISYRLKFLMSCCDLKLISTKSCSFSVPEYLLVMNELL